MKFSTGLFDSLFGKKTTLEIPQDDGTLKKVRVTEAWLKRMKNEGHFTISEVSDQVVNFHVLGLNRIETQKLRVGTDIPKAKYEKLKDDESGDLYGMTVYKNGTQTTNVISKQMWKMAKEQYDEIEEAGKKSMEEYEQELRKRINNDE
jgi:hypothetical protein